MIEFLQRLLMQDMGMRRYDEPMSLCMLAVRSCFGVECLQFEPIQLEGAECAL